VLLLHQLVKKTVVGLLVHVLDLLILDVLDRQLTAKHVVDFCRPIRLLCCAFMLSLDALHA
jgi:hypothetical protein